MQASSGYAFRHLTHKLTLVTLKHADKQLNTNREMIVHANLQHNTPHN